MSATDCRLPWRVIEVNDFFEVWTAEDERPGSKNNYAIATGIQDEWEANLIAAAPDLIAAARAMRDGFSKNLSEPMRLLNAAIDKAKGGAQ